MQFDGTLKSTFEIVTELNITDDRINFSNGILAVSGVCGYKIELNKGEWATCDNDNTILFHTNSEFNELYEIDDRCQNPIDDKRSFCDMVDSIKDSKGVFPNG